MNGTAVVPAVPALPPAPAASAVANLTAAECAADPRCYYAVTWNRMLQYMFIYHFFGLLWGHQFIVGFGRAPLPWACLQAVKYPGKLWQHACVLFCLVQICAYNGSRC